MLAEELLLVFSDELLKLGAKNLRITLGQSFLTKNYLISYLQLLFFKYTSLWYTVTIWSSQELKKQFITIFKNYLRRLIFRSWFTLILKPILSFKNTHKIYILGRYEYLHTSHFYFYFYFSLRLYFTTFRFVASTCSVQLMNLYQFKSVVIFPSPKIYYFLAKIV